MVLYIFEVIGTNHVKMGFTAVCPYGRIQNCFWKNVHPEGPEGCCGKLAWQDFNLIALVPGDLADEAGVKQCPRRSGSFGRARSWRCFAWPSRSRLAPEAAATTRGSCHCLRSLSAPSWPRRGEAGVLRRLAPALLWLRTAVQALDPLADSQARELSSQRRAETCLPLLRDEGDNKAHQEARGEE